MVPMNAASRSLRRRPRDDGERARFLFDLDTRQKRTKEGDAKKTASSMFECRGKEGRIDPSIWLQGYP